MVGLQLLKLPYEGAPAVIAAIMASPAAAALLQPPSPPPAVVVAGPVLQPPQATATAAAAGYRQEALDKAAAGREAVAGIGSGRCHEAAPSKSSGTEGEATEQLPVPLLMLLNNEFKASGMVMKGPTNRRQRRKALQPKRLPLPAVQIDQEEQQREEAGGQGRRQQQEQRSQQQHEMLPEHQHDHVTVQEQGLGQQPQRPQEQLQPEQEMQGPALLCDQGVPVNSKMHPGNFRKQRYILQQGFF